MESMNGKIVEYERTTLQYLKTNVNFYIKDRVKGENLVNMVAEKVVKSIDLNDYINSQILLLKFIKECMNELCKCDLEKLTLIFDLIKQFVDLSIDNEMYVQPLYIYLHFLIFNLSIELLGIFEDKQDLFKFRKEDIVEFKILLYLFGFRYFEFDKQRRMVSNKVLLSEVEQTLINCVEMIMKDKDKKDNFRKFKDRKKTNKRLKKVYTFVYSIASKYKTLNDTDFALVDNMKDLLIYLIESEINNLRYWNSPSTFHNMNKKYTPNSSKLKEEKVKDIFETAFSISNKLSIKLVQRFPWIERKFGLYIHELGKTIYEVRKFSLKLIFKNFLEQETVLPPKFGPEIFDRLHSQKQ